MKKLILALAFLLPLISCSAGEVTENSNTPKLKEGIRGAWVPAPNFTNVLHTHENMIKFVDLLDDLNMNAIFLVSYAGTHTIFKSDVLTKYSTYKTSEEGYMLAKYITQYQSTTNDPVRDLITEAHKRNIKVFFWFEYGFMGEGRPISSTNPICAKNPSWVGIGNDGKSANYNGSDFYYNAYNPEVQNFLIEMIQEAFTKYPDLDGVQGDDRMPAMPRNSGYDTYTTDLYKSQHDGENPPVNFNEPAWVRWRLDLLNAFGKKLYVKVKEKAPNAMVSFAPNPYPWCVDNLMQEWPKWCADGICDLLAVQCYRYTEEAYRATVSQVLKYAREGNPKQLVVPGMILMEGSNSKMTPELLLKQMDVNRQLGITGEIFFYNKALENPVVQQVLKQRYTQKVTFPQR